MAINIFMWAFAGSVAGFTILVVALIMYFIAPIRGTDAWMFIQARKNRKPVLFLDDGSKWRVTIGKNMTRDFIEDDEGNFIAISPGSLKWSKGVLVGVGDDHRSITAKPRLTKLLAQAKEQGWDVETLKKKIQKIDKNAEILDPEARELRIKEIGNIIKTLKKKRGNWIRRKVRPKNLPDLEKQIQGLEAEREDLEDITKAGGFFSLQNFAILRDYVYYGVNKTLNALRIRDMVGIKVDDVLKGAPPKKERDWFFMIMIIMFVMIIGVVAYNIAIQMMDYQGILKHSTDLTLEVARLKAQLISCQTQNATGVITHTI